MRVYLDHQAATPLMPEVQEAMAPFLRDRFGNPSSLHQEGFAAREALAVARLQVARLLGADSEENIIFTGNGTEAVNLGIKGAALANQRRGKHIILSTAEQPAVEKSCRWLAELGFGLSAVEVDGEGRIDLAQLKNALRDDTTMVCVHHANADIGTIQDIRALREITADRGILLFVDAASSAGWIPIDVRELAIDLLAISPHRFYGPKGVGVLYRHRSARIRSLIHGGEQEGGFRAGTENIPAIVGAGMAAEVAGRELGARQEQTRALQKKTLAELFSRVEYLKLNGPPPGPERHPANLNISVEFAEGEALGLMLDVKGVAIGSGSACVSKDKRIPPVLAAIGLPETLARGTVLISFGRDSTDAQIEFFVDTFAKAVTSLREMSREWEDFKRGMIKSEISPATKMMAI